MIRESYREELAQNGEEDPLEIVLGKKKEESNLQVVPGD
jgi:hypothetical protein